MKRLAFVALFALVMVTGCIVAAPPPPGGYVEVAPPLPTVVELGVEPFYFFSGYYYFYDNGGWLYSRGRGGPWAPLPRSHWPREIRRR